ncbi:NAD(P)H-hydrate epimerase [Enterobacter hormaechei]
MIVDGLLGTGLMRAPRDDVAALITRANAHPAPVVALDIPSGLMAQTGATPGVSIEAAHTVTFIALKPGCYRESAGCRGHVTPQRPGLENWLIGQDTHITRFYASQLAQWLPPRRPPPIRVTMADC